MTETILNALITSLESRQAVALVTVIAAPNPESVGRKAVVWLERDPLSSLALSELEPRVLADAREVLRGRTHRTMDYQTPAGPIEVFVEVQQRPPELIIVGAGHIAVPLARLGELCDFTVTVLDDRPQFANRQRFPAADEILATPLRETMAAWTQEGRFGLDTYVVLVTRGHQYDIDCLLEILDEPLAYIGMIGSKRRVRAVFDLLSTELGIAPERFHRVYAPIGLDIGAQTPAEIAVCIMAEIINVMRGGPARSLSDQRRQTEQQRQRRQDRATVPASQG